MSRGAVRLRVSSPSLPGTVTEELHDPRLRRLVGELRHDARAAASPTAFRSATAD